MDLLNTYLALNDYDDSEKRLEAFMAAGQIENAALELEMSERHARCVGEAFGEDTRKINDPETCAEVIRPGPRVPPPGAEPSFVRRMVALWLSKLPTPEDILEALDTDDVDTANDWLVEWPRGCDETEETCGRLLYTLHQDPEDISVIDMATLDDLKQLRGWAEDHRKKLERDREEQ